jgi:hypothetical protein
MLIDNLVNIREDIYEFTYYNRITCVLKYLIERHKNFELEPFKKIKRVFNDVILNMDLVEVDLEQYSSLELLGMIETVEDKRIDICQVKRWMK